MIADMGSPYQVDLDRHAADAVPPLVDAISSLYEHAIDRLLLTPDRVTSAAEGKRLLAADDGTEVMADQVQRVVVLAVPVVRTLARGARFTRVPWVLVATTAFSIASTLRTGVREVQVLGSLLAHRLEQADGPPGRPRARQAARARALPLAAAARRRSPTGRCPCAACSSAGCSRARSGVTRDGRRRRRSTPPSGSTCARISGAERTRAQRAGRAAGARRGAPERALEDLAEVGDDAIGPRRLSRGRVAPPRRRRRRSRSPPPWPARRPSWLVSKRAVARGIEPEAATRCERHVRRRLPLQPLAAAPRCRRRPRRSARSGRRARAVPACWCSPRRPRNAAARRARAGGRGARRRRP